MKEKDEIIARPYGKPGHEHVSLVFHNRTFLGTIQDYGENMLLCVTPQQAVFEVGDDVVDCLKHFRRMLDGKINMDLCQDNRELK